MTFQNLTLAGALAITHNLRAEDRKCLDATVDRFSPETFALNRWQTDGAAWQMLDDSGRPVCMGGISLNAPWLGVAWLVVSDGMTRQLWKKLLRFSLTVFANARAAIARIEAHVLSTWTQAARYARALGFEHEATRRRAGRDGQDVLVFAMVRE